ncbi:hypothetical protein [Streptomyces alkaliterrae]|uniref:Uncharacterized protein n=1 Tax=Streptomyces alkaliterrae TaxID=2213162 RepID=A0A5P0YLG4_9ACTN|nr:hypothetical protein [Streptomyces alkaliterrae]MBB1253652.1 hypothetical protein [Streptomyces alkaliterrae]MBB1258852.1 hypothetical protein [Streptomyces alkaliterrae]MQS01081.1 hypothetical protein [Streptomyces alkaliterrae]
MRFSNQGKLAVFAACAAAALAPAGTAVADQSGSHVPVDVPLQSLEAALPLDAPTVSATVPSRPLSAPAVKPAMSEDRVNVPLVPEMGAMLQAPAALVELPLPGTDLTPDGSTARVGTSSDLSALTPAAEVIAPLTNPARTGLPGLAMPDASVTTPALQGARFADVDVVDKDGGSTVPLRQAVEDAGQALGGALGTAQATLSALPTR